MASQELLELIQRVEQLPPDEQQQLAEYISRLTQPAPEVRPRRRWMDLLGIAPPGMYGPDAQEYVTQGRRESDEHRAQIYDADYLAQLRADQGGEEE